jgi:hypothetical protein
MGLDRLLRGFKNNNKEYIKIQFMARQTVKSALSDKRQLLKLALLSLIESWHADPIKFNSLIHGMPPLLMMSKSTMIDYAGSSSNYHTNDFSNCPSQNRYTGTLVEVLVNEAANLYEKMVKDFTNEAITNAVADSST